MPSIRPTIAQVLQHLETQAPSGTAEHWDNVGLLTGDPRQRTAGAVIGVDLTEETIELARRKDYRLIVIHHPCIFPRGKGLSRIVNGDAGTLSSLIFQAVREGIAVVACHTNFDRCALEVIDEVAGGLKVIPKGRLFDRSEKGEFQKLVVFVPGTHLSRVRDELAAAGAGKMGNYDHCTFGTEGEGTFRGGPGTDPFLGEPGRLEHVREIRLETIIPRGLKSSVLRALRKAHPYEEVAYDLYPVEQSPSDVGLVKGLGYGFWGDFKTSLSFSDLLRRVRSLFSVKGFLISGSAPRRIQRVAFSAGKGSSFLDHANSLDCDVMITGEAGYHSAIESARAGTAVIELGHRESEIFVPKVMSQWRASPDIGIRTLISNTPIQRLTH
jgi:dinuclear metal center YbgI/SA1388 family protein